MTSADDREQRRAAWIEQGLSEGWISEPFCSTHELGMTDDEIDAYDPGDVPCLPALRLLDL